MNARLIVCMSIAASLVAGSASAEEKLPPIKPIERLLPPKGIDIGKVEREKLETRLASLIKAIADAKLDAELRPDVEIFTKAVRWALDFDEFYDAKKDIAKAHVALDSAQQRLNELKPIVTQPAQSNLGKALAVVDKLPKFASWESQRGLLVRGYRSDIDDSVQPYGLHIPEGLDLTKPVPLLVWLHGRGDKETDLHFIATRQKNKGEFAPDWCITLHPFGRGTIGFKFAGEIDVLDAIESVKKRYKIDEDRIALAGFSMGGAGAWHIGAHYADKFCVVHAGAGFVETAKYNKLTPDKYPAWYEQKLWGWYDVPCYTRNLFNVPVIAYSGENDKQKQAADLMAEAFKAEGRELRHIIGPGVEHKYEAKAKEEVLAEIKKAVEKGREKWPKKVSLQTQSVRYARMYGVEILALIEHWKEAKVDAEIAKDDTIIVTTSNVECLNLTRLAERVGEGPVTVIVDGDTVTVPRNPFKSSGVLLLRQGKKWAATQGYFTTVTLQKGLVEFEPNRVFRKSHVGGSIDDAFTAPFLIVLPTGTSNHPRVQRWVNFESKHMLSRWRELFRGDPRVKRDTDFEKDDLERFNVIMWGDAQSNSAIAFLMDEEYFLPLSWRKVITINGREFPADSHVPQFIFPTVFEAGHNAPTTSDRYIVLNSGPTFREGHDRTNSQQTPKLPDWAIIGLDKDPDAFAPGTIKAAGFFDENWKVKKEEKEKEPEKQPEKK